MIGSANRTPDINLNLNSVSLISVLKMGDITLISVIKQTKINKYNVSQRILKNHVLLLCVCLKQKLNSMH